jgi:hypothetical protein
MHPRQRRKAQHLGRSHRADPPGSPRIWALLAAVLTGCVITAGGVFYVTHHSGVPRDANTSNGPAAPSAAEQEPIARPLPSIVSLAPTTAPPPAPANLQSSFNDVAASINGDVGISIAPVGDPGNQLHLGQWTSGPAWSTSKVPVVLAALREQGTVSDAMNAAITQSDNTAAEQVWASLGDPAAAKDKVEQVLRDAGDPTTVQSERVRPEFTAFGQTLWSLSDQASFLANASCDPRSAPVLELMGHIESSQSWGLGRLPGVKFKGGWGPSETGAYLVRQFGVIPTPTGSVAIAVAVEPPSGSFSQGTQALDTIADWVSTHLADLPAGSCRSKNPN